jgi:CRISPR system Cascade subunit CasE
MTRMSAFNLMHCQPDPREFVKWAARHGWLPPGGDLGYAFHAALHAVFGAASPKPFCYRDERAGLLAYTSCSADELRDAAALCPSPELAFALGLDAGPRNAGLSVRSFPTRWSAGRALGFEVRVRPVHRGHDGRERDALLAAVERKSSDERLERETVYAQWLAKQLASNGAATLLEARMTRFQLTSVIRRTQANARTGDRRKPHTIVGPDAVFAGQLSIEDPDAFAQLIVRGIGRHRSFGFGMLLLRPASIG